jgi:membrane associated rhomboid family serine protease
MIPLSDSERSYSALVVTMALIVVNVLVFLYEVSLDSYSLNYLFARYGIVPARFEYIDLLTSMFLHGGWLHLIGNMWFLWIFGDNVEDLLGHGRFLLFYLLCGVAAGLTHVAIAPDSRIPTVGASGAIAGVMGAYMVRFPRSTITTLVPVFVFLTTVEVPAALMLMYWFIIQLFSGVGSIGYTSAMRGGGVAWFAHVGGFLAGALLIRIMKPRDRFRHRPDLLW